jgi:hypothetical protein
MLHARAGRSARLLEEQLESQLIPLRGGQAAIHQVVESDDKPTGMRAKHSSNNGPDDATDNRTEKKWTDRRTLRLGCCNRLHVAVVGWIIDMSRHPFVLPRGVHNLFSRH